MNPSMILLIPILMPVISGILVSALHLENRKTRQAFVLASVLLTSAVLWLALSIRPQNALTLIYFGHNMSLALRLDGLSCVFAGLVSVLWPIATIYAFEYMKHEGHEVKFFTFYTITYGVTLGIAFAANFLTMYLFYELMTLVTLPLVAHKMDARSHGAGKTYILYSIGGASCSFIGMVCLYLVAGTTDFTMGGVLGGLAETSHEAMLAVFVLTFMGLGVKAAIFPLHGWLPSAGVAPTTVTALLHAVAVVKAGAFATMRVVYYLFGADFVRGTWAQDVVLAFAAFTIVFGSIVALKQQHIKRRLAYSTISNLSYILFGVALMTPMGLVAALTHLVAHALIKITLFYCAGAIIYKARFTYVLQTPGIGKKMPVVMACFTLASLALAGVPLLPGFLSKSALIMAAADLASPMAYVGIGALLLSSLLTMIYLFSIIIPAYAPGKSFNEAPIDSVRDPNRLMTGPLVVLCVLTLLFGLFPQRLLGLFASIATGGF